MSDLIVGRALRPIKRYGLSEARWERIALVVPGNSAIQDVRIRIPVVRERMFVGAALRRALVQFAGAIWQVEDRLSPSQSVVSRRCLGARVRKIAGYSENI